METTGLPMKVFLKEMFYIFDQINISSLEGSTPWKEQRKSPMQNTFLKKSFPFGACITHAANGVVVHWWWPSVTPWKIHKHVPYKGTKKIHRKLHLPTFDFQGKFVRFRVGVILMSLGDGFKDVGEFYPEPWKNDSPMWRWFNQQLGLVYSELAASWYPLVN